MYQWKSLELATYCATGLPSRSSFSLTSSFSSSDKGDFMSWSRSLYCHSDTGPTGPTALILRDRIRSSLSRPFILVLPSRPFILARDCFRDYLVAFENASEITWLRSKRRVSEFFAKCRWKRTVDRRHKKLAHRVGKVRTLSFSKECSSPWSCPVDNSHR